MTPSVVRIGDTVHRSRGPQSVFAAELLTYLGSIDFPYAPRYLGVDEDGRDVLTFIEGGTTDHPSQRAPEAYRAGGRMLRALHDATAGHPLAGDAECVTHGDPGAFNTIFRAGVPVAFIDWDISCPGRRLTDLAYMAWTWCIQAQGNVPVRDQTVHLRELRDGYGPFAAGELVATGDLLNAVVQAQTGIVEGESAVIRDPGASPVRSQHAHRAIEWADGDRKFLEQHRRDFLAP
jgi:hypothetical protein